MTPLNDTQIALKADLEAGVASVQGSLTTLASVSASCQAKGAPIEKASVDALITHMTADLAVVQDRLAAINEFEAVGE